MRQGKLAAGLLLSTSVGLLVTGCFTGGVYQVPKESLATDLTAETTPRVTRLQQADPAAPGFRPPPPPLSAPPPPPPTGSNGTKQVANIVAPKTTRINVRAWVNGKPLFDEEVMQQMPPNVMREVSTMQEPQRSERMTEAYNQTLDGLIEQELAYQDAVHKLEVANKKTLEKLFKIASGEADKQLARIRESGRASEEQIKEVEHILRKQTERNLISGEYMRSRALPPAESAANSRMVEEYYRTHLNEFQRLDTVKWQDVFIAVGPKHPTVAAAKRFAEDLVAQCRTNEDFARLIQLDDGDSKFRNGEGLGAHRGEIKPAELEETLFRLKEGQIGPVIELSTGVHMVRLLKREFAGQIPLDEKLQKSIKNKIKSEVYEREFKRIMRELKSRATIEIERGGS